MSKKAPDGRTWLEYAADWHKIFAEDLRLQSHKAEPKEQDGLLRFAEQHEAMSQACREAMG